MARWELHCDSCGAQADELTDDEAHEYIASHKCVHFEDGQRVRSKYKPDHVGTVLHQTDERVLWNCDKCMLGDDLAVDLELVKE